MPVTPKDIAALAALKAKLNPETTYTITLNKRELDLISEAISAGKYAAEECENYEAVEELEALEDALVDRTNGAFEKDATCY